MNPSRDGEIGRRSGLKIRRSERTVGVRFPLPAPAQINEKMITRLDDWMALSAQARQNWVLFSSAVAATFEPTAATALMGLRRPHLLPLSKRRLGASVPSWLDTQRRSVR